VPSGATWQGISTQLVRINEASNPQALTIQQTADGLQDSWELNPNLNHYGVIKVIALL
jgi:hypothetical protein